MSTSLLLLLNISLLLLSPRRFMILEQMPNFLLNSVLLFQNKFLPLLLDERRINFFNCRSPNNCHWKIVTRCSQNIPKSRPPKLQRFSVHICICGPDAKIRNKIKIKKKNCSGKEERKKGTYNSKTNCIVVLHLGSQNLNSKLTLT